MLGITILWNDHRQKSLCHNYMLCIIDILGLTYGCLNQQDPFYNTGLTQSSCGNGLLTLDGPCSASFDDSLPEERKSEISAVAAS